LLKGPLNLHILSDVLFQQATWFFSPHSGLKKKSGKIVREAQTPNEI
jgi:hypothetical protein